MANNAGNGKKWHPWGLNPCSIRSRDIDILRGSRKLPLRLPTVQNGKRVAAGECQLNIRGARVVATEECDSNIHVAMLYSEGDYEWSGSRGPVCQLTVRGG